MTGTERRPFVEPPERIVVVCCGVQGRIAAEILRLARPTAEIEFVDDQAALWGTDIMGIRVSEGMDALLERDPKSFVALVAIGHPKIRMALAVRLEERKIAFTNAAHPCAVVMPSASLGQGITLHPGAVVNTGARIGDHALINTAAVVEHDAVVADHATLCPGVQIGGRVRVGRGAFLCTGAVVLPRLTIGAGAVIATGAVVTHNVPENVMVMGSPARVAKPVDGNFPWERLL